MAKIFKKKSLVKLPQRSPEPKHNQYGREKKGVIKCPKCKNVHFKKRWYSSIKELRNKVKDTTLKTTNEELCPACKMIKEHLYEGELFVEKFPNRLHTELKRVIRNFGERATEKDPQDRIIKVEKTGSDFRVITTENQMADKLAKKIKSVFKKVEVSISHSKEPYEVDRVHATYTGD